MTEISEAELAAVESYEQYLNEVEPRADGSCLGFSIEKQLIVIIRTLKAQLEAERATMDRIKTDAEAAKEGRYPLEDFLNRVLILLPPAPANTGESDD